MEGPKNKNTKRAANVAKRATTKTKTVRKITKSPVQKVRRVAKKPKPATAKRKVQKKKALKKVTKVTPIVATKPTAKPVIAPPLTVQPGVAAMTSSLQQRSKKTPAVHPLSLRHHFITIVSLTICAALALFVIGGFTQTTLMELEALSTNDTSILMPTPVETRLYNSVAGEVTVALPMTWTVTSSSEVAAEGDTEENTEIAGYTHTNIPNATISISVNKNETENVFTWLQQQTTDYTDSVVVASSNTLAAWQGVTVQAVNTEQQALILYYIPIQKNLGERYVLTIRATLPMDAPVTVTNEINQSLAILAANLAVQ